jgi:hypothetical protein
MGETGSFELLADETGFCHLMRSPEHNVLTPWESLTFVDILQFEDPAAFWAWMTRDPEWILHKPLHLDPLMAGLIGPFATSFKQKTELNQMQHISLMHWEGAVRRADPGFESRQFCGICRAEVKYFPRYPKYLCQTCEARIADAAGRPLVYTNTAALGYGCQGYYTDIEPHQPYGKSVCYVDGIACEAQEARFGGIVIQKMDH